MMILAQIGGVVLLLVLFFHGHDNFPFDHRCLF